MCSMFTATLTSEIINARAPANTEMAEKVIAVMKGRSHDIQLVTHQGGVVYIGKFGHTMRGMNEMISLLESKTVEGFLVDRNTHYHFMNRIKEKKYKYIARRLEKIDMIKAEKSHPHNSLTCGMLIRNLDDYNYFKAYFDNNRMVVRSCNAMRMNTKGGDVGEASNMFSSDSDIFQTVITYTLALLGVMILFGCIVEGRRYYYKSVTTSDHSLEHS